VDQSHSNYWHPVRLFALCSLFSLLAIRTGDLAFLWYLLFLLFLFPVPVKRSGRATGFLPFVNEGGRRVVRWHRLALVWVFVISATTVGCCAGAYLIVGDWSEGLFMGVATGVTYSAAVTFDGFMRSAEELPLAR
jgi:hypothetical protein